MLNRMGNDAHAQERFSRLKGGIITGRYLRPRIMGWCAGLDILGDVQS